MKIYRVSAEVWGNFIYENHQRIEDLYMDLLPWSFVKAIRDQDGKDINMVDQIKKYKRIIIEASAIGPGTGPGQVRANRLPLSAKRVPLPPLAGGFLVQEEDM